MQFTVTLRSNRAGQIKAALDAAGANTGTLKVYTGASPGVGLAATGTLLATLTAVTLTNNANGTLTVSATQDASADASGTPGYCRFATTEATPVVVMDLTAGVGSGECNFDTTITANGTVSLTSGTITEGNA